MLRRTSVLRVILAGLWVLLWIVLAKLVIKDFLLPHVRKDLIKDLIVAHLVTMVFLTPGIYICWHILYGRRGMR